MTARALILDYGEVLVSRQSPEAIREMAGFCGLGVPAFHDFYWKHRPAYDTGAADAREYWRRLLDDARPGAGVAPEVVDRLIDLDARSWTRYREDVWQIAAGFRAAGGRTAFLSNGVPEVMSLVRAERDLARWFNVVIVSYEVGFTKPDARIYRLCLSRLGVRAEDAMFVDDRPANLEGAAALGIRSLRFTSDDDVAVLAKEIQAWKAGFGAS
jgi:putative hydrolase of the HAD superfamily